MAIHDHKAGLRPSLLPGGSQTPSFNALVSPGLAPVASHLDPMATALAVLTYMRGQLERRQWLVIPWGLPGDPVAGSLTREALAALDVAVHSIEQAVSRPSLRPAVTA